MSLETNSSNNNVDVYHNFADMKLKSNLLKGLFSYGFEKPSNIQQRAIMPFVNGRDILAQSQSGTGKTATFSIGVLQNIDESNVNAQAIILAPTRELAKQIHAVVNELSKFTEIKTKLIIGG